MDETNLVNETNLEGFHKEKLTISLTKANVVAFLLLIPVVLVFAFPYFLIWDQPISYNNSIIRLILWLLTFIVCVVLHELVHGLTWAHYSKEGWKSISFGVMWKQLTPYCHCNEPLRVKPYVIGALMPMIVVGIIPAIVSIIIGSQALLVLGILLTDAAAGDIMVVWVLRHEKADTLVEDHPTEAGCWVYRKDSEQ